MHRSSSLLLSPHQVQTINFLHLYCIYPQITNPITLRCLVKCVLQQQKHHHHHPDAATTGIPVPYLHFHFVCALHKHLIASHLLT